MKRLLTILLLIAVVFPAAAQTAAQKSKSAKLQKEIAILDKQLSETRKQSKNAETSLKLTRKKISNRKALVAESEKQIAALDSDIEVIKKVEDAK